KLPRGWMRCRSPIIESRSLYIPAGQIALMIDREVLAIATQLVEALGGAALDHAEDRATDAAMNDDPVGVAVWDQVVEAVRELLQIAALQEPIRRSRSQVHRFSGPNPTTLSVPPAFGLPRSCRRSRLLERLRSPP